MTKRKTFFYHVARATMTLLVMLLTTATAWAEQKSVSYLKADGTTGTETATVLTNETDVSSSLPGGWYVVEETVSYSSTLEFTGDTHLILADGCTMNIGTENDPISSGRGINAMGDLTIYGQSEGEGKGTLTIYAKGYGIDADYNDIIVNGGNISAISTDYYCFSDYFSDGITTYGNITINGGTLIARALVNGIKADENIVINGGSIGAIGECYGINANGNITIATSTIEAGGNSCIYAGGNISIESGTINVIGDDADFGISACGDIMIEDGTVSVKKNDEEAYDAGYAIKADGTINITGGTVKANGSTYGIYASGDITIVDGEINATAISDCGINANGEIKIYGGTVDADTDSEEPCIFANGNIIINDGTIRITDKYYGLYGVSDIIINGGTITTTGISYGSGIEAYGNITITDGTVTTTNSSSGIYSSNNITISGGTVSSSNTTVGIYCYSGDITITGGNIDANGSNCGINVYNQYHNLTINGGTVNVNGGNGIKSWFININGGIISAEGQSIGIYAKNIILAGGTVYASSYNGTVAIADDIEYSDGVNEAPYEGTLTSEDLNVIKNKTLTATMPETYTLTANLVGGYYWSTFYFGSLGFKINDEVNAYAYTAELGTDEITLHLLGKVIPKGTAVIIVGEEDTNGIINMTASTESIDDMPENDLHGVDVETATDIVLKKYKDATTLCFLSNKNSNFGFHDFDRTTVPARKAFLAIEDSNNARSFSMVFENETTGIRFIDNGKCAIGNEVDEWYDLSGRRLSGEPLQRGIYVNNGNKIVIK